MTDIAGDEELLTALSTVLLRSGVTPPWPVSSRVAILDLDRYLRYADAPDELALTSTLARLLPARLRSSEYREQRLFMSVAPELAAVPWPILPIDSRCARFPG